MINSKYLNLKNGNKLFKLKYKGDIEQICDYIWQEQGQLKGVNDLVNKLEELFSEQDVCEIRELPTVIEDF